MTPSQTKLLEDIRSGVVLARDKPDIEALVYRVANAKLGEGPSVRCEGPTDFEKDQARHWVRRILSALSPSPDLTPALVEMIEGLERERDEALRRIADMDRYMVPLHEDGTHVFIDGPGDVELDHGGKLRSRALTAEAERDALREALAAEREACAEAVTKRAIEIGWQVCCGEAVGSPPECCGDPNFMINDREAAAVIRARALMQETRNGK